MNGGKTILGIDPGTNLLGFGVIRTSGKNATFVDMGILDLRKDKDNLQKLKAIYDCISEVCKTYRPDCLAVESPFYGKNAQVILKLGRAQGAAMIAAMEFGIPVFEYAPRKAKMAIVGNGAASKDQVAVMLEKTLGVKLEAGHLDATDALAIALCHHYETINPLASAASGKGGWEKFIKDNPDRIKK